MAAVTTPGRTTNTLAVQPRDGALLQAAKAGPQGHPLGNPEAAGTAAGKGEEELADGVVTAAIELSISRASTRFEVRLSPRRKDGSPHEENLALLKQLDEASHLVAACKNKVARWLYLRDASWLEQHPWSGEGFPDWAPTPVRAKKKGKRKGVVEAAPLSSLAYEHCNTDPVLQRLDGSVRASITKNAVGKWCKARFKVLALGTEAPPFFKPHQPIDVPHQAVRLVGNADGSADIRLRVLSVGVGQGIALQARLVPRDSWQREELRALTTGEWRVGSVILSRHAEKKGRWYVRIAYTRLVPLAAGASTVVLRRGMKSFLMGASSFGDVCAIVDGGDILNYKRGIDARRRSIGRRTRAAQAGRGATGHGVRRRVAPLIALSDAEARFVRSRNQQAAAAAVTWALKQRARELVLEDFGAPKGENDYWLVKRWPWYALKEAVKTAAENAGLKFREIDVRGNKLRCPECGHEHATVPVRHGSWGATWVCDACGMTRAEDQIVALNMLRDVAPEGVEIAKANRRAVARAAKGGGRSRPQVAESTEQAAAALAGDDVGGDKNGGARESSRK